MNEKSPVTGALRAHLLWPAAFLFVLAAIGAALSVALGVHGFGRGVMIGAAVACIALGGVLVGLAVSGGRRTAESAWLPSRNGDA